MNWSKYFVDQFTPSVLCAILPRNRENERSRAFTSGKCHLSLIFTLFRYAFCCTKRGDRTLLAQIRVEGRLTCVWQSSIFPPYPKRQIRTVSRFPCRISPDKDFCGLIINSFFFANKNDSSARAFFNRYELETEQQTLKSPTNSNVFLSASVRQLRGN